MISSSSKKANYYPKSNKSLVYLTTTPICNGKQKSKYRLLIPRVNPHTQIHPKQTQFIYIYDWLTQPQNSTQHKTFNNVSFSGGLHTSSNTILNLTTAANGTLPLTGGGKGMPNRVSRSMGDGRQCFYIGGSKMWRPLHFLVSLVVRHLPATTVGRWATLWREARCLMLSQRGQLGGDGSDGNVDWL